MILVDEGVPFRGRDVARLLPPGVVSARYERASIVLTSNNVPAKWASTFNNAATLASTILDRLSHHCHSIVLEGESYRSRKI
jgi:DNA replication protein DnaC